MSGDPRTEGARAVAVGAERKQMQREYRALLIAAQRYFDRSALDHAATCPAKLVGGHPGESCKCGSWRAYEALESILLAGQQVDAEPSPGVVYWLAETTDPPAQYVVRGVPGEPAHLTADPLKATRFATKYDCLAIVAGRYASAKDWKLTPREHMFMGPT